MATRIFASVVSLSAIAISGAGPALAQTPPRQVVKPPVAQAWIDVATFSGFGIGAMGAGGGSGQGMMGMTMGALMGGPAQQAEFGNTETGAAGRWMDVTLYTSRNPNLQLATQSVPPATGLAPSLKLMAPERPKPVPRGEDEAPTEFNYEPPKGKLLLYWGCSETVRPGQPKVVDLQTATMAEFAKFFESRRSTTRGAHAAAGRPVWPSRDDKRVFPAGASIAGPHAYQGDGVPESFKFSIPAAQDIMPALQLKQSEQPAFVRLDWNAIPTARAYFLGSMGAREGEQNTIVIWTSSELPDSGFGLFDYQTNRAIDGWLKDKVLLPPTTTTCAIPKEAAGQGMLRAIAYGSELNMAYPPRPTDPAVAWEPDWNVKIRVKSLTTTMFGMPEGAMPGAEGMMDAPPPDASQEPPAEPKKKKKWNPLEVLKDAVGGGG